MCGIFAISDMHPGGFTTNDAKKIIPGLSLLSSLRGIDSTGMIGLTSSGKIDTYKTLGSTYRFMAHDVWEEFSKRIEQRYNIVIGHNRSATIGRIIVENAHPFQHKHITMVHNGTLRNHNSLAKKYGVEHGTDSEFLCWLIAEEGIEKALKEITGAYAIIYHDATDNTMKFIRNTERPLSFGVNSYLDRLVIASEKPAVIFGMQGNTYHTEYQLKDCEVDVLYSIPVDEKKVVLSKRELDLPKYYGTSHYYGTNTYQKTGSTKTYTTAADSTLDIPLGKRIIFNIEIISDIEYDGTSIAHIRGKHNLDSRIAVYFTYNGTEAQFLETYSNDTLTFSGEVEEIVCGSNGIPHLMIKDPKPHKIPTVVKLSNAMVSKERFEELAFLGCVDCGANISFSGKTEDVTIVKRGGGDRLSCALHSGANIKQIGFSGAH